MVKLTEKEIIDVCKSINLTQITENMFVGHGGTLTVLSHGIHFINKLSNLVFDLRGDIELGMLLAVFQNYGIIHERYIYERLDAIVTDFEDNFEDN